MSANAPAPAPVYNIKYFNDNAIKVDSKYGYIYDLDGHRLSFFPCESCSRKNYYNVCVDGITIATSIFLTTAVCRALSYLNAHYSPFLKGES